MRFFYLVLFMVFIGTAGVKAQSRVAGFPDIGSTATVRFYPNPASSYITFEDFLRKYDKNYHIQVFKKKKKKVAEFNLGDPKNILNLSDFFRGIYVFQLKDASGKIVESGKFQVNK